MPKIGFYRQERRDGGIRTGIEVNGEIVLGKFESTGDDLDPALLWYVDVTCEGPSLPKDPESARQWLMKHADAVRAGLKGVAAEMLAEFDADSRPVKRRISKAPPRVRITIACPAVRRATGREMSRKLRGIADEWNEQLRSLAPRPKPRWMLTPGQTN